MFPVLLIAALAAGSLQFRTAQEPVAAPVAVPREIRALYLTANLAGGSHLPPYLDLLGTTQVNGLVVDLKDSHGRLAFRPANAALARYAAGRPVIADLPGVASAIHARGGYAIARFPVFQDTTFAEANPSEAIRASSGGVWHDRLGGVWLDPASRATWDYAIAVAQEAHDAGFDEVNFDYIRFPSDGPGFSGVRYPRWDGKTTKRAVITEFASAMDARVRQKGIRTSADLFGLVFWAKNDLGIGQHLEDLAPHFDVLAPMVYPSHYRSGFLGHANPAKFPYEVIRATLDRGRDRLAKLPEQALPTIRPWLQDFQLGARYGASEVIREQAAGRDGGGLGWMIWNPKGSYSTGAFLNPLRRAAKPEHPSPALQEP